MVIFGPPAAAKNVGAVVVNAPSFNQTVIFAVETEQLAAAVIVLGSESRTSGGQVVDIAPPARPRFRIDGKKIVEIQCQTGLKTKNPIVIELNVLQRSQRIAGITLNDRQIKDRDVLGFEEHIIPTKHELGFDLRLARHTVVYLPAENCFLGNLSFIQSCLDHIDL